jgi:hypothetical protein
MKKRHYLTLLITTLFIINVVSAEQFSIAVIFNSIDSSTMVLGSIFIIMLVLLNSAFSKIFRHKTGEPNKVAAGVLSFTFSLGITYGIYKTIDYENILYSIGLTPAILGIIAPLILLAAVIYLIIKFKSKTLLIIGLFFIGITLFTDWVYEKNTLLVIGIILIILWFLLWLKSRKKKDPAYTGGREPRPTSPVRRNEENQRHEREIEEHKRRADEETRKRQEAEQNTEREKQKRTEGFNRARQIGINNLLTERAKLMNYLNTNLIPRINALSSRMGGGAFPKQQPNENDYNFKRRYDQAREDHKNLSQTHQIAKDTRNKIIEIDKRIEHLRKQLQR